ncbi:MAG TPA: bifunctional diguanylate cyclase/phosphodiesterase [Acidimicrobiales bacterium]|nr:bifunctional diguanylate cyclase/phosphodiesterase [Acidimicrobiales bacterium]
MELYDPLTGLPTRGMFTYLASYALDRLAEGRGQLAVMKVDLDRFHSVNDTLGHEAGDEVIRAVAERLGAIVSPDEVVARLAGDEFLLLLEGREVGNRVDEVAARLLAELRQPVQAEGRSIFVTASFGWALTPDPSADVGELIANAGIAAARAKRRGGGRVERYDESMRPGLGPRDHAESSLHLALERDEFEVHYQPVLALADRRLVGVEALVRWRHPEHGLVLPVDFIHAAEVTGLIVPIGAKVLRLACETYQLWAVEAERERRAPIVDVMEVNLSARQLADPGLVEEVRNVLLDTGMPPNRLMLEITESALMTEPEEALGILRRLKNLGVRLAVDDFGTGFSSLSYLRKFPLDGLKIDKSFIDELTTSPEDAVIVASVVDLAHALGLEVVAEGVEEENQIPALEATGCDMFQGWLYSPPVGPSEFVEQTALDRVSDRGGGGGAGQRRRVRLRR